MTRRLVIAVAKLPLEAVFIAVYVLVIALGTLVLLVEQMVRGESEWVRTGSRTRTWTGRRRPSTASNQDQAGGDA